MSAFNDLATAAALGTATRGVPGNLPPEIAGALPSQTDDQAERLLDALAAFAAARAAAVAGGPETPLVLPPATARVAPPEFVALIHRARGGAASSPVLQEAYRALAERSLTLPPGLLLPLLVDGTKPGTSHADVAALAAILDDRGRAVARLNPAVAAVLDRAAPAASDDPVVWDEGTLAERFAYLRRLRASDAAAGLALLTGPEWARETAEARAQFVAALRVGLTDTDEPFLTACLDDRSKGVRAAAVRVLSRLPGSALVGRAEALAARHLTVVKRLLREPVLTVTRPALSELDGRDALTERPGGDPLLEAIARVPAGRWSALLGHDAPSLARLRTECDGVAYDVMPAWSDAARRASDAALAEVVVRALPASLKQLGHLVGDAACADAIAAASRTELTLTDIADLLPERLGARSSAQVAGLIGSRITGPAQRRRGMAELTRHLSLRAEPASAARLAAELGALADQARSDNPTRNAVLAASATLQLRSALAGALVAYPAAKADHEATFTQTTTRT